MKLNEIKTLKEDENDEMAVRGDEGPGSRFANDYSVDSGKRLTDEQFQMAYKLVSREELDKRDIKQLATELADSEGYGRTADSAEFVLSRMHILVHGIAPYGETANRAESMFTIPKTMMQFAERQGYDVYDNIAQAKRELMGRPIRVKEEVAKKMMAEYYRANKDRLPKEIVQHREELIRDIMAGVKPEEAFAKFA